MPRIQNIGFQLKQSLRAMAAFGESEKAAKRSAPLEQSIILLNNYLKGDGLYG